MISRKEIDREVLKWISEPWEEDSERFNDLALKIFRHQVTHCAPYKSFCQSRGISSEIDTWRDIPVVPTTAFKEFSLRAFPKNYICKTFRTSGTSQSTKGELHLDTLQLYEKSLRSSFERGLLPDVEGSAAMFLLAPSAEEVPDSSLSHMFSVMLRERGLPNSRWLIKEGELMRDSCLEALNEAQNCSHPVLFAGAAFAWVHLLEFLRSCPMNFKLSEKARCMETGGFKGKVREVNRRTLYAEISSRLGISTNMIVNQYGMTELGSQFYDSNIFSPGYPRKKMIPPWVRVQITDPITGTECRLSELGIISIFDLANTGSILAIQTSDVGKRTEGGFEVIGRSEFSDSRGCSIAIDEMLESQ